MISRPSPSQHTLDRRITWDTDHLAASAFAAIGRCRQRRRRRLSVHPYRASYIVVSELYLLSLPVGPDARCLSPSSYPRAQAPGGTARVRDCYPVLDALVGLGSLLGWAGSPPTRPPRPTRPPARPPPLQAQARSGQHRQMGRIIHHYPNHPYHPVVAPSTDIGPSTIRIWLVVT